MVLVNYGIGEEKEHYLYLKEVNDNDVVLLNHLGFEPLDSNNGAVVEESDVETWVKYYHNEEIDDSAAWEDDSDRGCADCPPDECHGHCMSCYYRPV